MKYCIRRLWVLNLSLSFLWSHTFAEQEVFKDQKQPNILFILTDDQDLHMESLAYMPYLKKHIADQGTTFTRHYCTVALCCPSRVSLWTGKAAHNTNVTDVNPPYGGYPKFITQGFNSRYLPIWMQDLGYNTYYTGKLFNAQTVDNYASPPAAGWTGSEFLLDPYTYAYLNATMTRNGELPVSYEGRYSTDLVAEKSLGFLSDALESKKPFFLTIAPIAPHSNVRIGSNIIDGNFTEHTNKQSPPVPAARHKDYFKDVRVPRTPHFNPQDAHGVSWIGRLPKQNQTNVDANDHFYRSRLRSLQAVDEMVETLIQRLDKAGILDKTYVFFSTDNGYHIGQHRLQPGKQCAFEEDVNIPLMVRGPGIAKNHTTDVITSHTDLAPTFLTLAGGIPERVSAMEDIWAGFDGTAIPLNELNPSSDEDHNWKTEHVNIEMWGIIQSEGKYGANLYQNHTYKALRVIGKGYNLLYTVWCNNEHELYDLTDDPYEMENLYTRNHSTTVVDLGDSCPHGTSYYSDMVPPGTDINMKTESGDFAPNGPCEGVSLTHLVPRLDTLMQVLRTCKGQTCVYPWNELHPDGKVSSLKHAMREEYDTFYEVRQDRVQFERCEKGYILESEGPVGVRPYLEGIGG